MSDFQQVKCRIFTAWMSYFHKSDVGFSTSHMSDFCNLDVVFSQVGCRIFTVGYRIYYKSDVGFSTSRMWDFHNSDVGFSQPCRRIFNNSDGTYKTMCMN